MEVTPCRVYKKNDQAFVEQKNGAVVRRLVGYDRFEGVEAARALGRLYAAARLYIIFQPSFKRRTTTRKDLGDVVYMDRARIASMNGKMIEKPAHRIYNPGGIAISLGEIVDIGATCPKPRSVLRRRAAERRSAAIT
jgi:hypothetical protein